MKNILIIGLCVAFIGCAHAPTQVVDTFTGLEYGMPKQQMIALMGKPNFIEIFKKSDQTRMEFDVYVDKYQEKVPVCLIDNKIVGWGKTFYEDHVSMDDIRIK